MVTAQESKPIPIYVSYATFRNCLDWLKEMDVLPSQIDRSLWGAKFSGGTGSQLMAGLRFLGLLVGEKPTERLQKVAMANPEERKALMHEVLRGAYGPDLVDDLQRKTPKALDDELSELGATEATRRKAVSFFVQAAKAADVPMPKTIEKRARAKAVKPKSSTRAKPPKSLQGQTDKPKTPPLGGKTGEGNSRVIRLKSGGQLVLTITADLFNLSEEDRAFVFSLIDATRVYIAQTAHSRSGEGNVGDKAEALGLQ